MWGKVYDWVAQCAFSVQIGIPVLAISLEDYGFSVQAHLLPTIPYCWDWKSYFFVSPRLDCKPSLGKTHSPACWKWAGTGRPPPRFSCYEISPDILMVHSAFKEPAWQKMSIWKPCIEFMGVLFPDASRGTAGERGKGLQHMALLTGSNLDEAFQAFLKSGRERLCLDLTKVDGGAPVKP